MQTLLVVIPKSKFTAVVESYKRDATPFSKKHYFTKVVLALNLR